TLLAITAIGAILSGGRQIDRVWHYIDRRQTGMVLLIVVAAASYFIATGRFRAHVPRYHDEFVYLTHARMLARGRLWMRAHVLVDFFDSEYLLMQPVYSVQTWPGYAMIVALGIWLHIPAWIVSVIISAGVVGLFFLIVSDLMGRKWGFLAVLFLIAVDPFRHQS